MSNWPFPTNQPAPRQENEVQSTATPAPAIKPQGAEPSEAQRTWLLEKLKVVAAQQLGLSKDDIGANTEFVDDLGADSLDQVELVMAVEDEFNIELPDDEADTINTITHAVPLIHSRLSKQYGKQAEEYRALA